MQDPTRPPSQIIMGQPISTLYPQIADHPSQLTSASAMAERPIPIESTSEVRVQMISPEARNSKPFPGLLPPPFQKATSFQIDENGTGCCQGSNPSFSIFPSSGDSSSFLWPGRAGEVGRPSLSSNPTPPASLRAECVLPGCCRNFSFTMSDVGDSRSLRMSCTAQKSSLLGTYSATFSTPSPDGGPPLLLGKLKQPCCSSKWQVEMDGEVEYIICKDKETGGCCMGLGCGCDDFCECGSCCCGLPSACCTSVIKCLPSLPSCPSCSCCCRQRQKTPGCCHKCNAACERLQNACSCSKTMTDWNYLLILPGNAQQFTRKHAVGALVLETNTTTVCRISSSSTSSLYVYLPSGASQEARARLMASSILLHPGLDMVKGVGKSKFGPAPDSLRAKGQTNPDDDNEESSGWAPLIFVLVLVCVGLALAYFCTPSGPWVREKLEESNILPNSDSGTAGSETTPAPEPVLGSAR